MDELIEAAMERLTIMGEHLSALDYLAFLAGVKARLEKQMGGK
jgi:hypothetical protein